jgi:taurine dioxygenase
MGDQTIDIRKSTPHIGAEIFGVDLSHPLGNQKFQEVHDALMDRLVIFFRDQTISVEEQKHFARRFGKLHTHPASPNVVSGHPEVMVIAADENSKYIAGEDWHSDVSCDPEPPMGTMLYLTEVPPDGGGDTMFANMYLAYQTLSEPIRKLVDGLSAIHDGEPFYRGRYGVDDSRRKYPRAEHPVVRTHPVTGKKALYVNRGFTRSIIGIPRDESDAMLAYLYQHAENPLFQCRFRWTENAIAFWDNRCAQHRAMWDYWPHTRSGTRVTVKGERPV